MRHNNYHQLPSGLISPALHRALVEAEQIKTRLRMWVAFIIAMMMASLAGGFLLLMRWPLWVVHIIANATMMITYWAISRLLHRHN